jgi:hypothetical protein
MEEYPKVLYRGGFKAVVNSADEEAALFAPQPDSTPDAPKSVPSGAVPDVKKKSTARKAAPRGTRKK